MGARKIVDEQEVIRWFNEGKTYQWMTDEYQRKYGIRVGMSTWGNFRRRRGLERRIVRDDELIPWFVREEHRWAYPVVMLRYEGRLRVGKDLTEDAKDRLASWKEMLEREDAVVHYDPETEEGFHYIPREPQDNDLIRRPRKDLTQRPAADE